MIYYLDEDPNRCAQYHCDQHVRDMLPDYGKLLETAMWEDWPDRRQYADPPYALDHPCVLWLRQGQLNFRYLRLLAAYLNDEHKHRFGYHHPLGDIYPTYMCYRLPHASFTPPPHAVVMPEQIRDSVVETNRVYYRALPFKLCYSRRCIPHWLSCPQASPIPTP